MTWISRSFDTPSSSAKPKRLSSWESRPTAGRGGSVASGVPAAWRASLSRCCPSLRGLPHRLDKHPGVNKSLIHSGLRFGHAEVKAHVVKVKTPVFLPHPLPPFVKGQILPFGVVCGSIRSEMLIGARRVRGGSSLPSRPRRALSYSSADGS